MNHEHVIELQPLRRVNGHQLYRVAVFLLEIDLSVGLLEVIEILREFLQPARLAFRLPFEDELPQPRHIFPVLLGDRDADLQAPQQFVEPLQRRQFARALPQISHQRDQRLQTRAPRVKRQFALRRFDRVPQRSAAGFRQAGAASTRAQATSSPKSETNRTYARMSRTSR